MKPRISQMILALCALVVSVPAFAAAQRTFGASYGSPANTAFNCSIARPCRAFSEAMSVTIAGGEIIVLDSAGYGPVTINQSVSIVAPTGVYAGISVPNTGNSTGVAIAGAAISVALRGITINSTGGMYGIRMTLGSELTVEHCVISNFVGSNIGVSIETAATVKIADTVVRDNGNGIIVGFGATANIANSQVVHSSFEGIEVSGGSSGTTTLTINDTLVTDAAYCIDNYPSSGMTGRVSVTRATVTGCTYAITNAPFAGGLGTTTVSNSMVTANTWGFLNNAGTFKSLGNNHVADNQFDAGGTITTISPI